MILSLSSEAQILSCGLVTFVKVAVQSMDLVSPGKLHAFWLSCPHQLLFHFENIPGRVVNKVTHLRVPRVLIQVLATNSSTPTVWLQVATLVFDMHLTSLAALEDHGRRAAMQATFIGDQDQPTGRLWDLFNVSRRQRGSHGESLAF